MASTKKRRLGRGLTSLVSAPVEVEPDQGVPPIQEPSKIQAQDHQDDPSPLEIKTELIAPNIFQPRRLFDEAELTALSDSVRKHGVMQPIVVRPRSDGMYELIAGERRLRASKMAGLHSIPAVVREIDDRTAAEWALVENIQRKDLNAVERARGLARLQQEFAMTQAQIAEVVGIDRSSVANLLRILSLEDELLELIASERLTLGHAKALLSFSPGNDRVRMGERAASEKWSVRKLETHSHSQSASSVAGAGIVNQDPAASARAAHVRNLESVISDQLGTRVQIVTRSGGKKGTLRIEFFDAEHFEGLIQRLGISLESSF